MRRLIYCFFKESLNMYRPTRKAFTPIIPASAPASAPSSSTEDVLHDWDRLQSVLRTTHNQIPTLLAEKVVAESALGAATIDSDGVHHARQSLADVDRQHGEMTATRSAVLARMIAQKAALESARL